MSEAMSKTMPPLPEVIREHLSYFTNDAQCELTQAIEAYAIAAIEAQGVPDGWRPIETAPKDVPVLLYGAKRLEMCVGMNHSRDGWVTDTTSEWASMYPPTHWMPRPTAPGASSPPAPQAAVVQQEKEFDDCFKSPTGKHSEEWLANGNCQHCNTGEQNAPLIVNEEPNVVQQEPLGFMNAGHVYELQQKRIPYGYVYPEEGAGAHVAVYTHPAPQAKPQP